MTGRNILKRNVNPDGQWETIKEVLSTLHQTAGSGSAKGEIQSDLQAAERRIEDEALGPLFEMCQKIHWDCEEKAKTQFSKYHLERYFLAAAEELREKALPLLLGIKERFGETSEVYSTGTRIYCMGLRVVAIDLSNRSQSFSKSLEIINEAIAICRSDETRQKLASDLPLARQNALQGGSQDLDYHLGKLFHLMRERIAWFYSRMDGTASMFAALLVGAGGIGLLVFILKTTSKSGTDYSGTGSSQGSPLRQAQPAPASVTGSTAFRPTSAQKPNPVPPRDPWAGFVETPAPDSRTQQRNHNPQPPPGYTLDPPKPQGTESSPAVGPSTEPRFLADEDVEVISPTTSEGSANAVRIQQLKQEIEDGKSRLESLEHRLKLLEIDNDSQKLSLNYLKSRIDSIESDANAGLSYDEYDYKNKIDEYNSKLRSLRSASTDYDVLYGQYESLLKIVNGTVRTYNNLIGASR
jgi:hypothetical protein